ncbi:GTP cyclohydrolase II, putative [Talaromyces stipitatus ATCC 10500]|uniref:GTP cyclohydrolase II n=1 Tax=Talaromyces stipitatus (strain ATCC 10500 / CBS 375.48 / QM 6759 / NRRL 1006) TaxID=441959 RepID=B8M261_TALSN|nr:GTP cyclohydrolase II, putative [Talaromyces stipitatus ATCC 10500]EED21525.1 GTP cyclohydrolase II, putative [Talaromyces stipitatus ATCC 10500]
MAEESPYIAPQPRHPNAAFDGLALDHSDSSTSLPADSHDITSHRSLLGRALASENASPNATPALPESIISPAITPPSTPGGTIIRTQQAIQVQPNDAGTHKYVHKGPKLMDRLPNVECIVRARIPTTTGAEMFLHLYQNDVDNKEHLAIVFGNHIRSRSLDRVQEGETEMDRMIRGAYVGRLHPGRVSSRFDDEDGVNGGEAADKLRKSLQAPLVRIHSECYTGETAWSARCDCGEQLDEAARLMSMASESPSAIGMNEDGPILENTALPSSISAPTSKNDGPGGVIIYLRQEGRGIGLGEKLKAYNLQDLGSDTVEANLLLRHPADARSYGLATSMLVDLGLGADAYPEGIRLLTNNPDKVLAVEGPNREVRVKERVAMIPIAWRTGGQKGIRSREIEGYLQTKIGKMGHMIR